LVISGKKDQEKFEQGKLRSEGLFKRKRIDDLKSLWRFAKSRRPSDRGEVARGLTRRRSEESVRHRVSAYRGWRVQELYACRKLRVTIPRFNRSRQSSEGQVARDPEESGLGTSALSKSKGARRNSEIASCDGPHRNSAER
jgi:hypothetical protein